MDLNFDTHLCDGYHSKAQIARVLTEDWMAKNMFCPRCGRHHIERFPNNRPVADFFCPQCKSQFELKSKQGTLGKKIADGAYETMISRITSNDNPDFFFMSYSMKPMKVRTLLLIPKNFFVPKIIEKRKSLKETARRAGWTGCNILLDEIPQQGRIEIVVNGIIQDSAFVIEKMTRSDKLTTSDIASRSWLMDILNYVNKLPNEFSLEDIYAYADLLRIKHPRNNNVKPKIRQQLQILRDKRYIEFLGNGRYKKLL